VLVHVHVLVLVVVLVLVLVHVHVLVLVVVHVLVLDVGSPAMSSGVVLIAVAIGLGLLLIVGGGIGLGIVLGRRSGARSPEGRWAAATAALGLAPEPGGAGFRRMLGTRSGVDASVRAVFDRDGSRRTHAAAAIEPPLRLGLHMVPQGGRSASGMDKLLGAQDVEVGFPPVDGPFVIRGFDPQQLRAFFQAGAGAMLGQALPRKRADAEMVVTDRQVELVLPEIVIDAGALGTALDFAASVAAGLADARRRTPFAPWETHLAGAWGHAASVRGLAFVPADLTLQGEVKGTRIRVVVDQDKGAWSTIITGFLARPLPTPLRLFKEDGRLAESGRAPGMQDIDTGDPVFDRTFVVQGDRPAEVRGMLDGETRYYLLQLASGQGNDVVFLPDRIVVQLAGVIVEPDRLLSVIDRVAQLSTDISSTQVGVAPAGRSR